MCLLEAFKSGVSDICERVTNCCSCCGSDRWSGSVVGELTCLVERSGDSPLVESFFPLLSEIPELVLDVGTIFVASVARLVVGMFWKASRPLSCRSCCCVPNRGVDGDLFL